jgi:carboxylesterase type B
METKVTIPRKLVWVLSHHESLALNFPKFRFSRETTCLHFPDALQIRSQTQQVPSYSYLCDIAPAESYLDPAVYGVPHFSEIPYIFGNTEAVRWEKNPIPQGPNKAAHIKMIKLISRMWISSAVLGSRNNHKRKFDLFFAQHLMCIVFLNALQYVISHRFR